MGTLQLSPAQRPLSHTPTCPRCRLKCKETHTHSSVPWVANFPLRVAGCFLKSRAFLGHASSGEGPTRGSGPSRGAAPGGVRAELVPPGGGECAASWPRPHTLLCAPPGHFTQKPRERKQEWRGGQGASLSLPPLPTAGLFPGKGGCGEAGVRALGLRHSVSPHSLSPLSGEAAPSLSQTQE